MGRFFADGHEVRNGLALGAAAGALAGGLLVPQMIEFSTASEVSELHECRDFVEANPDTTLTQRSARELPATVLKACGVNQYLELPDDTPRTPDVIEMNGSIDYMDAGVLLPIPEAVQQKLEDVQDKHTDFTTVAGIFAGGLIGGLIGENRRDSVYKRKARAGTYTKW